MHRPSVAINVAMSADGKIASAAREPGRLTTEADLHRLDLRRAEVDAVLVGAETVRRIDPPLHIRDPEALRQRGDRAPPMQIVLSATGDLDPGCRALREPSEATRVLATTADGAKRMGALPPGAEAWALGESSVDLPLLLQRLHERDVASLICEGGGLLNAALLEADLVDELYLTVAPSLLGGGTAPTPIDGSGLNMSERRRLELVTVEQVDAELFLHYRVQR